MAVRADAEAVAGAKDGELARLLAANAALRDELAAARARAEPSQARRWPAGTPS